MKRLYFLVLVGVTLLLNGCGRTCENVKVGNTQFSANTTDFLTYNTGDKLTFSSGEGELITFNTTREESSYFICQKVTCNPIDPYKSSYCEYIEAPQTAIYLNTDSTLIAIEAGVFAYEPETELFYDAVRFTLSHVNSSTFASHITDVKFTDPVFIANDIPDIDFFMVEQESVTLRERSFANVLICEEEDLALFYTKAQGIVGFRIKDKLFVLED